MSIEYAIIVKNKTRLESLIERFNTKAQAKFYIEKLGGDFQDYEQEHENFHTALNELQTRLSLVIKNKTIERAFVPSFIFTSNQLIVVIGQDGLVANTAKYAKGIPIVAVNPDKKRYDGILLPYDVTNFFKAVQNVLAGKYKTKTVRFAEAVLNDGQRLLAFNDLYIGASTHVSARYKIGFNNQAEEHSSSGIIVSTQAGMTGWMSSVFNMAYGITGKGGNSKSGNSSSKGKNLALPIPQLTTEELLFVVREPFASQKTQTGIITGKITGRLSLTVESLMPNGGVIFSDGIESDFIKFNSGVKATIRPAQETANLVVE